jgi:hypothetical protein
LAAIELVAIEHHLGKVWEIGNVGVLDNFDNFGEPVGSDRPKALDNTPDPRIGSPP